MGSEERLVIGMKMKKHLEKIIWVAVRVLAVLTSLLAYTSLIIPQRTTEPALFGIPYTLWTGVGISLILVALIIIGSIFAPDIDEVNE